MNYLELFENFNVNINESHGVSPLVEYLLPYYLKSINELKKKHLYIDIDEFERKFDVETVEKFPIGLYKKYFIEIPFEIIEKGFNQFYKEKNILKLNKNDHKFATFIFNGDEGESAGFFNTLGMSSNQNDEKFEIIFLIGINSIIFNDKEFYNDIDSLLSHEIKHMIDSIFYDEALKVIYNHDENSKDSAYSLDPEENKARISEYYNGIKKIKDIKMLNNILKILHFIKNIKYNDFSYELINKLYEIQDYMNKDGEEFHELCICFNYILTVYGKCYYLIHYGGDKRYNELSYIVKSKRKNIKKIVEKILKIEGKFINNLIKITYDRYVKLKN